MEEWHPSKFQDLELRPFCIYSKLCFHSRDETLNQLLGLSSIWTTQGYLDHFNFWLTYVKGMKWTLKQIKTTFSNNNQKSPTFLSGNIWELTIQSFSCLYGYSNPPPSSMMKQFSLNEFKSYSLLLAFLIFFPLSVLLYAFLNLLSHLWKCHLAIVQDFLL